MNSGSAHSYSIDNLLTINEVATKLRVAVKTVRDWAYRGKIPFTRIGRRLYFSAEAIEAVLAANEAAVRSKGNRQGLRLRQSDKRSRR